MRLPQSPTSLLCLHHAFPWPGCPQRDLSLWPPVYIIAGALCVEITLSLFFWLMYLIPNVVKTKERIIKNLQGRHRQAASQDFSTEINVREHLYHLRSHALGSHRTYSATVHQMPQLGFSWPLCFPFSPSGSVLPSPPPSFPSITHSCWRLGPLSHSIPA